MIQHDDSLLDLAIDRLEGALAIAPSPRVTAWEGRLARALAQLEDGWSLHTARLESPEGLLAQAADPSLLPFSEAAQLAQGLRQEHADLGQAIASLRCQLEWVAAPAAACNHPATTDIGPSPLGEGAKSKWYFDERRVSELLAAIQHHRRKEKTLGEAGLEPLPQVPEAARAGSASHLPSICPACEEGIIAYRLGRRNGIAQLVGVCLRCGYTGD
jgi:hypothetical protein